MPTNNTKDTWDELGGFLTGLNPDDKKLVASFRNGENQHLMFLGIFGFVVCDHENKEILLIDPWASHHSEWTSLIPTVDARPLTNLDTEAKERVANLASFLRTAVEQEYSLKGILLSHMHFDHADDIPILLELLAAKTVDWGSYTDHLGRQFLLSGKPVEEADFPPIICDYDSQIYLKTYGFYVHYDNLNIDGGADAYFGGNEKLRQRLDIQQQTGYDQKNTTSWKIIKNHYVNQGEAWKEIRDVNLRRLRYNDSFNNHLANSERCPAGQICTDIELGNFKVTPYTWDHMNVGAFNEFQNEISEQSSGHLERTTVFNVESAKGKGKGRKTCFVGSSGEMRWDFTGPIATGLKNIETDVLVHALVRRRPHTLTDFTKHIDAYLGSMLLYFHVRKAVIFTHWEEYIRGVTSRAGYRECFRNCMSYNFPELKAKIALGDFDKWRDLVDNNRFYALARQSFDFRTPLGPEEFANEKNRYI